MKDVRGKGIPEFKTLDEEREYWEARGPLAEGRRGTVNRPRQRRSSFLVVRLTGDELTCLRDVAAKQGLGPSTYARKVIKAAIGQQAEGDRTLAEIINKMDDLVAQLRVTQEEGLVKKSA